MHFPFRRRRRIVSSTGINVTRDGPNNVYVPQSTADWQALGLVAPLAQWNCQEASGNLLDAIGAIPLTPNASPLYQQTVTGWTRFFAGTSETVSMNFTTLDAALDVTAGQSYAMLCYLAFTTAVTNRRIFLAQGTANNIRSATTTTTFIRTINGSVGTNGTVDYGGLTTVNALFWYRNATTNASGAFSNLENVVGAHDEAAITGQRRGFGAEVGGTPAQTRFGLGAVWKGADAETIAVKATLTTLGWSVAW